MKKFLHENPIFLTNSQKFSPLKVSRYTVYFVHEIHLHVGVSLSQRLAPLVGCTVLVTVTVLCIVFVTVTITANKIR